MKFNTIKNIIISVFIILLWIGCAKQQSDNIPSNMKKLENLTAYSTDTQPKREIQFVQQNTFGQTDEVLVGEVGNIAVDDEERVFIGDPSQQAIHVFKRDGSYLRKLGREGDGPGEFRGIRDMRIHTQQIFVIDEELRRINIYSLTSFDPVNHIKLNPQNWNDIDELTGARLSWDFYPLNKHKLLMPFNKMHDPDNRVIKYYYLDDKGKVISEKIHEQKNINIFATKINESAFSVILPFSRKPFFDMSSEGHLYSAWSEKFLIKVYDSKGEYIRAFYHPFVNSSLNQDEIIKSYQGGPFANGIREADFPETWPALDEMFFNDEDRLWVSTIIDDNDVYEWWILKKNGEVITKFKWPRNKPIEVVRNGYMYTRETEKETGLQQIVKYRIEMNKK